MATLYRVVGVCQAGVLPRLLPWCRRRRERPFQACETRGWNHDLGRGVLIAELECCDRPHSPNHRVDRLSRIRCVDSSPPSKKPPRDTDLNPEAWDSGLRHGDYLDVVDLPVADAFVIPEGELEWSFSTSGGPGGQHANRNATKAELRWDLEASAAVGDDLRHRLATGLGSRVRDGVISVTVGESRSQWRNRQLARRRLAELLEGALRERRRRVPTRPSPSATNARIKDKRRRGADKRLRQPPEIE